MTDVVNALPEALVERLRVRSEREGRPIAAVIESALSHYLDIEPFGFAGSFSSTEVSGRNAGAALSEHGFGE